jgi:D-alanine--poly(phosphoribitol) ligase subunit 1
LLIRRAIQRFIFDESPSVYDLGYREVPVDRVRSEYRAFRSSLLERHSPGDRVGLRLTRDYRYLLAVLACMETGIAFVPLRVEWPQARIDQIGGIVGFAAVFDDEAAARAMSGPAPAGLSLPPVTSGQPLYCLFTSGTTGVPKGVVIPRSAYENFLGWTGRFFDSIGPGDRLLNSTDFTFDVSLAEVAIALTRRAQFFCSRFRDDLFTLLAELNDLKISVIATVPNNFTLLLDPRLLERADLSTLRHALIAGSRFPVQLARQFGASLPRTRVYNCYGPTEATIYCIARELAGDESGFVKDGTVSVGTALPGCRALVVDPDLKAVAAHTRGELLIGGAQVMDSYLGNAEATRAALVQIDGERYYRTGDLAFRDERGEFYVCGRNDDTVKVSGQRVNLSDIDGYVQRLPFVKSCATIAIEDEMRGATLVLYVIPSGGITKEAAFEVLREVLPKHQLPQDIRFVDAFPLNNSGKVSKRALVEAYRDGR